MKILIRTLIAKDRNPDLIVSENPEEILLEEITEAVNNFLKANGKDLMCATVNTKIDNNNKDILKGIAIRFYKTEKEMKSKEDWIFSERHGYKNSED